ncbi:hypothetical protein SCLCIDRAFT_661064 [Scleroderma citrinum Foug A]|uniref:Protein kinase domain-containing protein n=1 Tax=Scleroderma citrinum Foug A TaxID=1036808 RepID=A0A0C3DU71_9AGAM|nr:hypothetical protein SCLCIDRAFT_661064 [Scleroderma citrinum Foug A]
MSIPSRYMSLYRSNMLDSSVSFFIQRSIEEVHRLSKLVHENILPLLGITTKFDLTVSLVSPWIRGGNAHDYVQNKAIDPRPIIEGIARGLCYLHNQVSGEIIHGNVKGFNVLISDVGRPLLTDFSLSRLEIASFSTNPDRSINWTALEVLDGQGITASTDVWSFGMTVLELFTRITPFSGYSGVRDVMVRVFQGPPDRPSDENTCHRLTDQWWDLCSACWNPEPSLRLTMSQIVDKITAIVCVLLTNNSDNTSLPPEVKLVVEDHPQASPVAHSQGAVYSVTIFTTEEKPLLSPVKLVLTLVPEEDPKLFGGYSPVVWRVSCLNYLHDLY